MRRQMPEDAGRMTQPAGGYAELFLENTVRSDSNLNRDGGIVTAYPGSGSIETSFFNALSSQSKNTVFIWDIADGPTFTLRYANPAYIRLLDRMPCDVFGKNLEDVLPRDDCEFMKNRFAECFHQQIEMEFIHEQFNSMHITRLCPQVEGGRTVRLIGTNTDITEYMREQNRLKAVNEQLRQQTLLLSARIRFESLLARTLREFMDSGSAGFDGCLAGLNRELGGLIGADQAFILQHYSDSLCIHKARWGRDGTCLCPGIGQIRSAYNGGASLVQINRLLVINDTRQDKPSPFSLELQQYGVRALLAVPICRDTLSYGLLCLVQSAGPRVWTTAEISMAKAAADTIMSAYLRTRLENGLCENIHVLTEYDEALQDLLSQKEMMAEVSGNFLHSGITGFDACAPEALADIGRLLGLDGLWAVIRTGERTDTYSWFENGLPRRIGYEYVRLNEAAGRAMLLRTPAAIDDTADGQSMPELARAAAEEGVRSLLIVPLFGIDDVIGVLTGVKVIGIKPWSPSDISSMEAFARIFADAYRLRYIPPVIGH